MTYPPSKTLTPPCRLPPTKAFLPFAIAVMLEPKCTTGIPVAVPMV